jgi:hypothetical protein
MGFSCAALYLQLYREMNKCPVVFYSGCFQQLKKTSLPWAELNEWATHSQILSGFVPTITHFAQLAVYRPFYPINSLGVLASDKLHRITGAGAFDTGCHGRRCFQNMGDTWSHAAADGDQRTMIRFWRTEPQNGFSIRWNIWN